MVSVQKIHVHDISPFNIIQTQFSCEIPLEIQHFHAARHVAKQNGPLVRGRCFGAVHQRRGCGEGQTEAWRRSDVELQRCKQIEDVYIYIYV